MIYLHHYHLITKDGRSYAIALEQPVCPDCGGPLKVRDSRKRRVIAKDGSVHMFNLRRLRCQNCQRIHLELPDLFIPYKHYSKDAIHGAVEGRSGDCPAEDSTIYRWKQEMN